MKIRHLKITVLFLSLGLVVGSCSDKLDLAPINDVTSEVVYATPLGYKQSLAKIYGTMALTGNAGGAGQADVFFPGSDEGQNSDFFRTFWKAQELTTDEAVIAWGDPGVPDFHNMSWSPSNLFLHGVYYKALYQITLVNEFLRQSTDEKLAQRGIAGASADEIRKYRPEVRFLRAFQYWVLMDLFGNPPFVTEESLIGGANPPQIMRADLFKYVVKELTEIELLMPAPKSNEYGRADQAAVWSLLARVYLNAGVYTSGAENKFTDAATLAKRVIDAGYALVPNYQHIMRADNHTANNEFIWTINYDGARTQGYGGTTFLVHASIGGNMNAADFGVDNGWGGLRTTSAFVNKFADPSGNTDKRAQFFTNGQTIDIQSISTFSNGYGVTKFKNITKTGGAGSNLTFADIDIPVFRLSEMYLIYAEAILRGGVGDINLARTYINNMRQRSYGNTSGNVAVIDITLNFIIDERSRELYWEGHRRTDLVRFDRFVESTYLWPWKGGVASGTAVSAHRKIFPIPSADINANRNLVQNPQY
ncbi:MAG: RagB/SusD family nutrient uptake outer membrane protein [Ferruginibacter sp.]